MNRSYHTVRICFLSELALCSLVFTQLQAQFDVFPLSIHRTFVYAYQYQYSDIELVYLASSATDSGTVTYTVMGSSENLDSSITWTVRQEENLYHHRFQAGYIDTAYWSQRDTNIILIERTSGSHELTCSSIVWSFPLTQPTQQVYRYSDHSAPAMLNKDTTLTANDYRVDTLWFDTARGFYARASANQFLHISYIRSSTSVNLLYTSTSVQPSRQASDNALDFELFQNYPNPFNPSTTIVYRLSSQAYVTLQVFDQLGRLVQSLFKGHQYPGRHSFAWYPRGVSSGIYFARLTVGQYVQTRKLILLQ